MQDTPRREEEEKIKKRKRTDAKVKEPMSPVFALIFSKAVCCLGLSSL
jgi:hypothetical protein